MICRVDFREYRGRAVTVERTVSPATLATAVREGEATDGDHTIAVTCRRPHPVHERVGCVESGMGLRPRTALAEAGRARGLRTPVDARLEARRAELDVLAVEASETAAAPATADVRREVAEAGTETDRLRERVASARGRLRARRETGADPGPVADELASAVGDLSAVETRAAAARERRERARSTAREVRNRLEARLELEDVVGNLERAARAHLVDRLRPAYEAALGALPNLEVPEDPFAAPPDAMALTVARVARFDAPVVVACERFDDAATAARWLGAPVVRCSP